MKIGLLHVDQQLLLLTSHSITKVFKQCVTDQQNPDRLYIFLRSHGLPRISQFIFEGIYRIYTQAFRGNAQLDVRIILGNLKHRSINQSTNQSYSAVVKNGVTNQAINPAIRPDVVFTDQQSSLGPLFGSLCSAIVKIDSLLLPGEHAAGKLDAAEGEWRTYDNVVIGGTFDHLHAGHKLLLSNAILRCNKKLTIGLTVQEMLKKKFLADFIQPIEDRQRVLQEFCTEVDPSLQYDIVPITDPFGPSIVDPDLEAIVASEETLAGANAVNVERRKKNLKELQVHTFPVTDVEGSPLDLRTISSSWYRQQLLGKLIRHPEPRPQLPTQPYLIGLTGGSGSGKTSIGGYLSTKPGVLVIDCDKIAHEAYRKESLLHTRLVEEYGPGILDTNTGEIARKELGKIVFSNNAARQKLNEMIWPEVMNYCVAKIREADPKVAFIDAALLIEAGWSSSLHEVWVTFVPEEEAVRRIVERDGVSEEYAWARIKSQMSNRDRIQQANLVFCSLWEYSVTQSQVDRAWAELIQRI